MGRIIAVSVLFPTTDIEQVVFHTAAVAPHWQINFMYCDSTISVSPKKTYKAAAVRYAQLALAVKSWGCFVVLYVIC